MFLYVRDLAELNSQASSNLFGTHERGGGIPTEAAVVAASHQNNPNDDETTLTSFVSEFLRSHPSNQSDTPGMFIGEWERNRQKSVCDAVGSDSKKSETTMMVVDEYFLDYWPEFRQLGRPKPRSKWPNSTIVRYQNAGASSSFSWSLVDLC